MVYPVCYCREQDRNHSGAIAATTALGAGAGGFYSNQELKKDLAKQIDIYSALKPDEWVEGLYDSIDIKKADEALASGSITKEEHAAVQKTLERMTTCPVEDELNNFARGLAQAIGFNKPEAEYAEQTITEAYSKITPELRKKLIDLKIINPEQEKQVLAQMATEKSAVLLEKVKYHGPKAVIGAAVGLAVALILNDFSRN